MDGKEDKKLEQQDQTGVENTSGADNASAGSDTTGQDSGTQQTTEKTFTQKQVSQMMAREKKQGRASAFAELGLNPDDAKTLAMVKALVDSQKSEEQKVQEQQAKASAQVAEAEQRAMIAEAKAEAMQLGVQPQFADDCVTLAISKMTEGTDLKTVLGELKTKYPVWFAEGSNDKEGTKKQQTGQKGTGSSLQGADKNKGNGTQPGLGKRLAAQRRTTTGKKSSFWDK